MRVLAIIGLIFCLLNLTAFGKKLEEKFAWSQVEYNWPSQSVKDEAIKSGQYIVENNLPLGLEKWNNRLFITVPRWKAGVASSLNYIDLEKDGNEKSPKLNPYPSWEANLIQAEESGNHHTAAGRANAEKAHESTQKLKSNSSIVSTFRIQIDECDRLWVLDTGLADILGKPEKIAPAAIVIFDMRTDTLLKRYEIPEAQHKEDTFFANVIVDTSKNDCRKAFAYVPDLGGFGLVVYSLEQDKSWRVKHNYFHFDPLMGDFHVGGVRFQWTDGVFGLALGNHKPDGTRDVYFHALASTKEFVVSNRVLQNESHVNEPDAYNDFMLVGDRGANGQSTAEAFDKRTNSIFYTQVNKDAVGCWNVNKQLSPDSQGLVDSDTAALVFPNDLKVDQDSNIWVLSDKLPVFIYKGLNPTAINYRVLTGSTSELVKGTPCE